MAFGATSYKRDGSMSFAQRLFLCSVVLLASIGNNDVAMAENLKQALSAAYSYNPELMAEQARLRAIDEGVAQAQSGYRPDVSVDADVGSLRTDTKPSSITDGRSSPHGYSVTLNQPLFRGFRTINGIRQAKASVLFWARKPAQC